MVDTLRTVLVTVQALTFVGLAPVLWCVGNWQLACAQVLLAGVTVLVYI